MYAKKRAARSEFCFVYYTTISPKNQQFDGKYEMKMTSAVTDREAQI